jgi:hypothetical protein
MMRNGRPAKWVALTIESVELGMAEEPYFRVSADKEFVLARVDMVARE